MARVAKEGTMPGALGGIKVLEVSQIIAGPMCGVFLSYMGADVVKVEADQVGAAIVGRDSEGVGRPDRWDQLFSRSGTDGDLLRVALEVEAGVIGGQGGGGHDGDLLAALDL